jgi:5-methylcytosine-specific restriction endonuclease McrA
VNHPRDSYLWKHGCGKYFYTKARRQKMRAGDKIDRIDIFEHYKWVCHICDERIDPQEKSPSLEAATLDHVTPLALGGTHTWDNVAPAHARCNYSKGLALTDR